MVKKNIKRVSKEQILKLAGLKGKPENYTIRRVKGGFSIRTKV